MELRLLRYFTAVAETRHFGRAAERLHIAQPPLSQAIRRLEAELGAPLLARTTRQVNLTAAGEVFYHDALRILGSVDAAVRRAQRVADGSEGVLRLGLTGAASYRQLPEIAQVVKAQIPGLVLDIHTEMLTPAQEAALLDGRIDLGVLRPPVREPGLVARTFAREPLVLALPSGHRLADRPHVSMSDLRSEDFVMYAAAGSVVNDAVVRSCHTAGFYPRRAHQVEGTSVLLSLVAAGLGVALVPDSVRAVALQGVGFRAVMDAEGVDLALAWRVDDRSPLLARLLAVLATHPTFADVEPIEGCREDHPA